ncbi:MAG: menaquinone biosynthesis decarboxylase, partial [Marinilabiliales bacterium]
IDPDTGEQNTGMYRMQIFDSKTTGMHWHRHKGGAEHYRAWQKKGKRMPVTVTLGGDPVLTYTASAPLPPGISEYMLAGFLKGAKVKLVKSRTNNIWIPECSDIVIEGYIDTSEPLKNEGPFGDHTGYYSLPDDYPVFHVTCITHRKDAVYPATVVGPPPKEDQFLGKATEDIFIPLIQKTMGPDILDMYLPAEGGFHNLALVKIKKDYPGQAVKTMHALWGAGQMMFSKIIMVFDENTDIRNKASVLKAISENVRPNYDIHMSKGPYDVLDHAAREFSYGGKAGIDATSKLAEEQKDTGNKKAEPADLNPIFSKNFGRNMHVIYSTTPFGEYGRMFTDFSTGHDRNVEGVFIITDQDVQGLSEPLLLWYILSVLDPERDFSLIRNSSPNGVLIINGARRGKKAVPGRKWPAVAVMSQEIIDKVNESWESYEIGPMIESPSEKVKELRRDSHLD